MPQSKWKAFRDFTPPLVIGVHGIRTRADWQRSLAETLSKSGIRCKSFNFGSYGLHRLIFKNSNEKMVDAFYDFYSNEIAKYPELDLSDPSARPSVVAHSFGTYIVGRALLKYPDIKVDKVILCGCILPRNFDLPTLFVRDQVGRVRNEFGPNDMWARVVDKVVVGTGPSGGFGLDTQSNLLDQERFDYYHHSDFFRGAHIESYWVPFLCRSPQTFIAIQGRILSGHSFEFILKECRHIDQMCYRELPHIGEVEFKPSLAVKWANVEPDIYTFLLNRSTQKAVGYINAMPMNEEVFDQIKSDGINANHILPSYIEPYEAGTRCNLYLVSIALDPEIRKSILGLMAEPLEILINGLAEKLRHYAIKCNLRVEGLAAVAWTEKGKKLCQILGMTRSGTDRFGHFVYYVRLKDLSLRPTKLVNGMRQLLQTYADLDRRGSPSGHR